MMKTTPQTQHHHGVDHKDPCVSVIIPAYNIAPFVAQAIDPVLAQNLTDYEIIVINDGSPDTEELKRALAPYVDRILYIQQQNQGAGAARKAGLRAACGKYVAFFNQVES